MVLKPKIIQLKMFLVGEKLNDNTLPINSKTLPPTGLLIDNLPFILMIGLGLVGFVALSKNADKLKQVVWPMKIKREKPKKSFV